MTKQEFHEAWQIASSDRDLTYVDDTPLHGCGLPDFQRISCTIEQVAKLLRWQCCCIFGGYDGEELAEMGRIARTKFLIC